MMRRLAALLILLLLLMACGAPLAAGRLLLAEPPAPGVLRVGFGGESRAPMSSLEDRQPRGFEALLMQALAKELNVTLQVVPLRNGDERFSALSNGTVDAVIFSFSVTAERSKLVQFVSPSYYSAGATLFAPGGRIEGVSSWSDLKGKTLAVDSSNYVVDAATSTPALQNVTLLQAPSILEAVECVLNGTAVAYIDDSTSLYPAPNVTIVPDLIPILRGPLSIAVQKGNAELAAKLSDALLALAEGGPDAPILQMENETFGAAGAAPNPDLAALVANPTPGGSLLYPMQEADMCGPVPSDSVWLPADTYQPVLVWKVVGVQNYSCDPTTGNWTHLGWVVKATELRTGQPAGYGMTILGSGNTHLPLLFATDPKNGSVLGSLVSIREATTTEMPSPSDPLVDFSWSRRPAHNQTGIFASPKILYLTHTDTEGGLLPPSTGPCKEGDPIISTPAVAIVTFFACREGAQQLQD